MKDFKIETTIILKSIALQPSESSTKLKGIYNSLTITAIKDALEKSELFKCWLSEFTKLDTKVYEIEIKEQIK